MSRWFRHYAGMMRDEKLVAVAVRAKQPVERVLWVWGAILESAAEINEGGKYELDAEEVAYFLRTDVSDIASILVGLEAGGRLASGVVVAWSDRQFESDRGAARQAAYRERKRNGGVPGDSQEIASDVTPPSRDAQVTPQETETYTEPDTEVGRGDARDLETKLREAAGWQAEPAPMLAVTGPIEALMTQGADLEIDVLPTVRALAPQVRSRTNWKYFLGAIAQARDDRIAAAKIVTHPNATRNNQRGPSSKPSRQDAFAILDAVADAAIARSGGGGEGCDEADYVVLPGLRESPA